jgi:hypothetical protein
VVRPRGFLELAHDHAEPEGGSDVERGKWDTEPGERRKRAESMTVEFDDWLKEEIHDGCEWSDEEEASRNI